MTTPNTPNPMQDDHGNYIDEFGLTQRFDLTEWWIQKGVPFTNAPARKRYSRKAWRLKKEIEAKSRDVLIKFIEGPTELRGFNYQIGDNDCEFCKG